MGTFFETQCISSAGHSSVLYGCECWRLRKMDERNVFALDMGCLRKIVGVPKLQKLRNEKYGAF